MGTHHQQSSWQYTQQSQTEVDQPPHRHGLRGGHRPDHQRSAPTGETHLPPPQSPAPTHLRPSGKESRQATRPNRVEGGRPLGRHRNSWLTWRQMGSLSDHLRRPSSQRLHSARDDTAWPYRAVHTNDPETLAPHEETDAQHRHPPGLKPLLSTGTGSRNTCTRATASQQTQTARTTFWQQILGDTEGTISNATTSRAITHAATHSP
jgi:hypothetical protein